MRNEDTVARQGGDEFIVVLPDIATQPDAGDVAQKILDTLAMPYSIDGHPFTTSVSIGIALYPDHGITAATLIEHSDAAMYTVKKSGRNRYIYYAEQ